MISVFPEKKTVLITYLWKPLISSFSIMIGTLPILCSSFSVISLYQTAANLIVLPLVPVVFFLGFLSDLAGLISLKASFIPSVICSSILQVIDWICTFFRNIPYSRIAVGFHTPFRIILWGIFLTAGCVSLRKNTADNRTSEMNRGNNFQKIKMIKGCLFTAAAFFMMIIPEYPRFRMVFLDIGQGDCILVQEREHAYLIDCGSSSREEIWESCVEKTLFHYGITRLDAVFISHADLDHMNGLLQYFEKKDRNEKKKDLITIRQIITSAAQNDEDMNNLLAKARLHLIDCNKMNRNDQLTDEDIRFICLYPGTDTDSNDLDKNETSMVLMLCREDIKILLTGDLEKEGENIFLEQKNMDPSCTILKCGHHGSSGASSTEFLEKCNPAVTVISCGLRNRYGHPHKETLERLEQSGTLIYRTDLNGSIILEKNRKGYLIETML